MLARMRRIDIVAPRRLIGPTMRAIHRAGVLHLVPFESPRGVGPATFSEPLTEARDPRHDAAFQFISELDGELGIPDGRQTTPAALAELWALDDRALLERVDRLGPVRSETARLTEARVRVNSEVARVDSYRNLFAGLSPVLARLPSVRGYGSTGVVMDARYRSVLGAIQAELERITSGRCEVVSSDIGPDRVGAVLMYPARHAAEIRGLLGGRDLEEVAL